MTTFAITERKIDSLIMQIEICKIALRYAHLTIAKKRKVQRNLDLRVFQLINCLRVIDSEAGDNQITKFHTRIENHIADFKTFMRGVDIMPKYKHPLHKQSETVKTSLSQQ